ncbi:unnamed protein product, partial [Tetraodon nigroviridis]
KLLWEPPSPLQSPARCSQTWWTRFSLTRNLTPRSSENAPPPSVRWTEKTVQPPTKKRRRRSLLWSTVWPVIIAQVFPDLVFCLLIGECKPAEASFSFPSFCSQD